MLSTKSHLYLSVSQISMTVINCLNKGTIAVPHCIDKGNQIVGCVIDLFL